MIELNNNNGLRWYFVSHRMKLRQMYLICGEYSSERNSNQTSKIHFYKKSKQPTEKTNVTKKEQAQKSRPMNSMMTNKLI